MNNVIRLSDRLNDRLNRRKLFRLGAIGALAAPFIIGRALDAEAAAILKQTPGAVSWTNCGFTATDFNSLAVNNIVVASSNVTNASNLDLEGQISFKFINGATATLSGSSFIFYALQLDYDGTTYGSGVSNGSTLPAAHEFLQVAQVPAGLGNGATLIGITPWFPMPIGAFKFVCLNGSGGSLNSSASAVVQYQTRNYNGNG